MPSHSATRPLDCLPAAGPEPTPVPPIPVPIPVSIPASIPVPIDWLEEHWKAVAAQSPDRRAGIFGPASISWKINRESAVFLGAGRAALLQLAHPWVAAALDRHSTLRADPVARFHNTFRVVYAMIFGTVDQALAASRHLYRLHTGIAGTLPSAVANYPGGSAYLANELHALRWVYATLVDSALLAYECALGPLTAPERESYYAESKTMAALFGIPTIALPEDWNAFRAYLGDMFAGGALGVNTLARELAAGVLRGAGSWLPVPRWYRALTAMWLPEPLRRQFALDDSKSDQESAARACRWLPEAYPRLPAALRLVGPYHEAQARLRGARPGLLVHLNNRFWTGQPRTIFAEPEPWAR
jgi:uncharacterized protein (DUF2236 family)